MPIIPVRYRYFAGIDTLIVSTIDTSLRLRPARCIPVHLDLPVQIYIEDTIRQKLEEEKAVRIHRHIELVSEYIASYFREDFDFNTSVFHQLENTVRQRVWQPRKPQTLTLPRQEIAFS